MYGSDSEEPIFNDTSAHDALRAQLTALYGPIESTPSSPPQSMPAPEKEQPEEFEFNLFAPSLPKSIPAHGDSEGKLVRQRKDGWWMADITEARRKQFEDVAVGMEDIRRWTETRWYGWEKPWKVRIIHTGLSPAEVAGAARTAAIARKLQLDRTSTTGRIDLDEKVKSKTKPNKKRRIILRSREKAAKEAAEAARIKTEKEREKKLEEDKDYAVKRNARNRERKVKRREREKRKKEALREGRVFVEEGSDVEDEKNDGGKEKVVA